MALKSFKYVLPISTGLFLCSCAVLYDEEYENVLKAEEEKIRSEQILLEKQQQINQQEQLNLQRQREQLKKEKNLLSQEREKIKQEQTILNQFQQQLENEKQKQEKTAVTEYHQEENRQGKSCPPQSCEYTNNSDGIRVWRCKNMDSDCNIVSWGEINDDFSKNYDANMNITSYALFDNTRDEYGNKTKVIAKHYDSNNNLRFTTETFYTYTDNSRKNYTWDDVKYQTRKEIHYDAKGIPMHEWILTYSDDGLEVTSVSKYYTKGQLTEERGDIYSSVCPYDDISVSGPFEHCEASRSCKEAWKIVRYNDKIFSKTYYSDEFETVLYTATYEYNQDNSYQIKYSDGRVEKYDPDGKRVRD